MNADFTALLVSGPDARDYLQGQLTCDMNAVTPEKTSLAAINSSQGRVQAVAHVAEHSGGFVLHVVTAIAEQTLARLKKYVLRAKVKIEVTTYSHAPAPLADQLQAGIPHVFPETHEAFVAQMLNLDLIGAISFNKGCYTGQEIIARTHYRGAIKRRMFRFSADCAPPAPGTPITDPAAESHVGDVVYSAPDKKGCELLAVVALSSCNAALSLASNPTAPLRRLSLPYTIQ